MNNLVFFLKNYHTRHSHPANIVLHLMGIPLTIYALIEFLKLKIFFGMLYLIIGFGLQYVGHKIEKSQMGEIVLIRKWLKLENNINE